MADYQLNSKDNSRRTAINRLQETAAEFRSGSRRHEVRCRKLINNHEVEADIRRALLNVYTIPRNNTVRVHPLPTY
ncbi:uncharacterized protein LOC144355699 [Saccoglossus kowalevskii]